ncbi:MAG TPA: c-type cytochrome [Casimicrobiaceae bacterium]|nr:c-type cytochrome [Casimicrobiaceae bacterium]
MKIVLIGVALAAALAIAAHAQLPAQRSQDEAKPAKLEICAACHGEDGNSTNPLYPNLAQQNARYMYLELKDFKEGRRNDPTMSPIAQTLDQKDMLALGDWFSKQKEKPTGFKADPAKVEAGRKVADAVLCAMCHGGDFGGQNEIPREAGQHYEYIKKQLQDFKAKRRTNDGGSMTPVAATLTDEQIDDLAQYVANLH